MLSLPSSIRVFLALGVTDMRKSIDGLVAVTRHVLGRDPFTGDLFAFCNRRRTCVKIIYWEGSGCWLLMKRLERGTFAWPSEAQATERSREVDTTQLMALLGGLVIAGKRSRWFSWKPRNTELPSADFLTHARERSNSARSRQAD
jgi:transposase